MSTFDVLPTPEACKYAGVCRDTLRRKLTPVGYLRSGRRGRPTALWLVRDLDEMHVLRRGGGRHA